MSVNHDRNAPNPSDDLDNSDDSDIWAHDEDEIIGDNPKEETKGTDPDSETDEAEETAEEDGEEGQEAEDPEEEAGDEDEEQTGTAAEDSMVVTLNDGEQVSVAELRAGYMKDGDYRQKTAATAELRRETETTIERVTAVVEALAQHMASAVPQAPSPELAMTNPTLFNQMKAQHDAGAAQINQILALAEQVQGAGTEMAATGHNFDANAENEALTQMFPEIGTSPEKRESFMKPAREAAVKLGFSPKEVSEVIDHRYIALAHYAQIGMKALEARKKGKAKMKNAPSKNAPKRKGGAQATGNRKAMNRLGRTGSIEDAMQVDFD